MKSRRKFLRNTGLITGGIITSSFANSSIKPYSKIVGANDRINFGVIGCKGMGWSDMRSILSHDGTDCIAIVICSLFTLLIPITCFNVIGKTSCFQLILIFRDGLSI